MANVTSISAIYKEWINASKTQQIEPPNEKVKELTLIQVIYPV
jgi:hypothetical protein